MQNMTIEAFGNLRDLAQRAPSANDQQYTPWDGNVAQTGFDEEGTLRCGICGVIFFPEQDGHCYGEGENQKQGKF